MAPESASRPETLAVSISRKKKSIGWDDLIGIRSANVGPKNTGKVAAAIAGGAATSLGLIIFAFCVRGDLLDVDVMAFVAAKLAFSLVVVGLSSVFLTKLARPGGELRSTLALTAVPFIGVMILATLSMAADPNWDEMIRGDQWLDCVVSVPIITIVPFATIMLEVRLASPVDLVRTGALAGLVAGGISVTAYALHCTVDPAPFVALWFGGTSILCMLSGAKLGPRLLRR